MIGILLVVVLVTLIYYYIVKAFGYWTEQGIPQGKVLWGLVDSWRITFQLQASCDIISDIYNRFPNARYTGMYQFIRPLLMIRDPELIKHITTKDFEHFVNHRQLLPEDIDPLWSKNLLMLQGKRWRDMRSLLSPSFTSSKMKTMFVLIKEYAENVAKHFLDKDRDICKVEAKDLFSRITNDIIASTSFGISVDSLEQPNNDFYLLGKEMTKTTLMSKLIIFGAPLFKSLFKIIKFQLFPKEATTYFRDIIDTSIKLREDNEIDRPDMINLMVKARKGTHKHANGISNGDAFEEEAKTKLPAQITNEDITSQAIIFFFGGFDSVSSLMSFAAYELTVHQDIQVKLRKEIRDTLEECGGSVTYDGISKMKYMDMVVSESLRKWPNFVFSDRECTKDYTVHSDTPDGKPLHIIKGSTIMMPVYGLHRDPKYYPDPERFDPERFNEENRGNINPYAYLPFSLGPRQCIGSRLAVIETKTVLFYILLNFEMIAIEETEIPLRVSKTTFNLQPAELWLGLKRIKSQ